MLPGEPEIETRRNQKNESQGTGSGDGTSGGRISASEREPAAPRGNGLQDYACVRIDKNGAPATEARIERRYLLDR
jgi:hypothetical protein